MPPREGARPSAESRGSGPTLPTVVEIHARAAASQKPAGSSCCWIRCCLAHEPACRRSRQTFRLLTCRPSSEDLTASIQTKHKKKLVLGSWLLAVRRRGLLKELESRHHPWVRTKQYLLTISSYDDDAMLAAPGDPVPGTAGSVLFAGAKFLFVAVGC